MRGNNCSQQESCLLHSDNHPPLSSASFFISFGVGGVGEEWGDGGEGGGGEPQTFNLGSYSNNHSPLSSSFFFGGGWRPKNL